MRPQNTRQRGLGAQNTGHQEDFQPSKAGLTGGPTVYSKSGGNSASREAIGSRWAGLSESLTRGSGERLASPQQGKPGSSPSLQGPLIKDRKGQPDPFLPQNAKLSHQQAQVTRLGQEDPTAPPSYSGHASS